MSLNTTDAKKERCFQVIDDLIERGVDVFNLRKELEIAEYERVRRRLVRNFGGVNQALIEYGFYDTNGTPSNVELSRCFYIDGQYSVQENTYEIEKLCDIYFMTKEDINKFLNPVRRDVERDAMDEFYRDNFPFEGITWTVIRDKYPQLCNYIKKYYKNSFVEFVNSYGFPYDIFVEREHANVTARLGHMFESRLESLLKALNPDIKTKEVINGCRPDFVVDENTWIDAKLSYYSVFDHKCSTLEKYLPHCSYLTIYYARFKRKPYYKENYAVLHVSEMYPDLIERGRQDLVDEMEVFIENA